MHTVCRSRVDLVLGLDSSMSRTGLNGLQWIVDFVRLLSTFFDLDDDLQLQGHSRMAIMTFSDTVEFIVHLNDSSIRLNTISSDFRSVNPLDSDSTL